MMNKRADAGNRPASRIEAAFSHAEAFDFIDLHIAFDGTVFSSSPISANTYDGPWEDIPCEHADFLVWFSSVYCAFGDFVKFLEAIAVGVEQCQFSWDAEGPNGCFSWQRSAQEGTGYLSVTWHSRPSFRYVVRIDRNDVVRALYGAFREFVESDAYDPVRYERLTIGEKISLVLDEGDSQRLPAELARLDSKGAQALLMIANGGLDERSTHGPIRRHNLSDCLAKVGEWQAMTDELGDAVSRWNWIPDDWDCWSQERRIEEISTIMGFENTTWYGANLRELRSPRLEVRLKPDDASLA